MKTLTTKKQDEAARIAEEYIGAPAYDKYVHGREDQRNRLAKAIRALVRREVTKARKTYASPEAVMAAMYPKMTREAMDNWFREHREWSVGTSTAFPKKKPAKKGAKR